MLLTEGCRAKRGNIASFGCSAFGLDKDWIKKKSTYGVESEMAGADIHVLEQHRGTQSRSLTYIYILYKRYISAHPVRLQILLIGTPRLIFSGSVTEWG